MLSRRAVLISAVATAARSPLCLAQGGPQPESPPVTVLRLENRTIEVNGKAASVFRIRQPDGAYGITTEIGKRFRVRVENNIDKPSLIHWHGLAPPWQQDGVPGIFRRRRSRQAAAPITTFH
jgi:FtsP/CotA-like multicopper oxidase with cupredoxin domain